MITTKLPFLKHTALSLVAGGFLLSTASAQTLLLQYNFDEASSGAQDAINHGSAAGANGSFVGDATRTAITPGGASTGALDLNVAGTSSYVTGGSVTELAGLTGFTLSVWVNMQAAPAGNMRLLANQAAGSFDGFSWTVSDPSGGVARDAANFSTRMFVGGSSGFKFDGAGTHTVGADNQWTFLAVTYDGTATTDNVNYYAGSESGAVTLLATTTINAGNLNNSASFNIGHTDAAPTSDTSPPGYLDDARVYSGVLSAAQLDSARLENIPEPSTYAAIFGGLALLGAFVYRRRLNTGK